MTGGVSHMDTFDPKPQALRRARQAARATPARAARTSAPLWDFKPGGKCGTEVTDLFPHVRECMDDICLIRSMRGDHNDHFQATLGIHTGSVTFARPSIGSWVSYGLGTENQNLPQLRRPRPAAALRRQPGLAQRLPARLPPGHARARRRRADPQPRPPLALADGAGDGAGPARPVQPPAPAAAAPANPALAARIKSFETAFGMQQAMPEVLDLSKETDATLDLYGLERGSTKGFAWQCLVARRLVERGVRFIELIDTGSSNNWDCHGDMKAHGPLAKNVDKPIAGLLRDLKSRGMLDDTLVVWTTEFGRTPTTDGPNGPQPPQPAPSAPGWPAAASRAASSTARPTTTARKVVENPVHVHDFHATILHLLGFDHERLTFRHAGRDFRLTDVAGQVVNGILA